MDLPPYWRFAIDNRGRIYYYHVKLRKSQWEPPTRSNTDCSVPASSQEGPGSSNEESSVSTDTNSDSCPEPEGKAEDATKGPSGISNDEPISEREIIRERNSRRKRRYNLLVQERSISPRREEDRIFNQINMRRYRKNKEKIRRRKEQIKQIKEHVLAKPDEPTLNEKEQVPGVPLPIQEYLLSSDEEDHPLIEKFVQGDKIVDELDALNKERPLKRTLSLKPKIEYKEDVPDVEEKKSEINESNTSEPKKPEVVDSSSNKIKLQFSETEKKFRSDIGETIIDTLMPYRHDTCKVGRITNDEDFKYLAKKLINLVMLKELKHCRGNGQSLLVTDSVKKKSKEFISRYMLKYDRVYIRPDVDL